MAARLSAAGARLGAWSVSDAITEQQLLLCRQAPTFFEKWAKARRRGRVSPTHLRRDLRRRARWWDLEATRGYPSSSKSREYAMNIRWLVELLDNGVDVSRPFHELIKERRRAPERGGAEGGGA